MRVKKKMKTVTYLLFAVVSGLVSITEARLARSWIPGKADKPGKYYAATKMTPNAIHREIRQNLGAKFHVMAELGHQQFRELTLEFMTALHNPCKEINLTNVDIRVPNLRLTAIEVSERIFEVQGAVFKKGSPVESLILSIVVPKIEVTFSSKVCQSSPKPKYPLTLVYFIENIKVDLKTDWPCGKTLPSIDSASIPKFEPGSIKSQVTVGDQKLQMQTTSKGSQEWKNIMNMMHSMMPDQPIAHRLLKQFALIVLF